MNENMTVDIAEVIGNVLGKIIETVELSDAEFGEESDKLLSMVEDLQEAHIDDQAVFVVRLLLNYLDEDKREEALRGFVEENKST